MKATFFLVGEMAHEYPATVRRIFAEGHTIGTHSENHPLRFGKLPAPLVEWEIDKEFPSPLAHVTLTRGI